MEVSNSGLFGSESGVLREKVNYTKSLEEVSGIPNPGQADHRPDVLVIAELNWKREAGPYFCHLASHTRNLSASKEEREYCTKTLTLLRVISRNRAHLTV